MARKKRKPAHLLTRSRALDESLHSLDRSRGPLFKEMEEISREPAPAGNEPPHICCTRAKNKMRITDLEAIDIARAIAEKPHLRGRRKQIVERIGQSIGYLKDSEDPQRYDCPLLEDGLCMVHKVAKPIACLAWNPGRDYSDDGWRSLERRDRLNEDLFRGQWSLKAIPLQLARFLLEETELLDGPCLSTIRRNAPRQKTSSSPGAEETRKGTSRARRGGRSPSRRGR